MALHTPDIKAAPPPLTSGASANRNRRSRVDLNLWIPVVLIAVVVGGCLLGPALLRLPNPNAQVLADVRLGPGAPGHLLGTDSLGRDILARVLHGGRVSLLVGASTVAIGIVVGGALGTLAGFLGGWVDSVVSRLVEILLAFPALILALTMATYLGPSVRNVILAISFYTIPAYIRLARAGALKLRDRDFVLAARLAGARSRYVLVRHIAPLVAQSLLAYGLLALGTAIIVESSLSFLGLGVRPPQATWGTMLADGKADLQIAAHIVAVPGLFLFVTIVSLNLLGDAIRTRLDRKVGAL